MKKYLFLLACVLASLGVHAQVAISDAYNAGSTVYNFSNAEVVTAHPVTGVGYVSNNSGTYFHHGPAIATITINGFFNAYDPNINGFTGTVSTPGIDWFQGLEGNKATVQEIAGSIAPRFGVLKLDNGTLNNFDITNSNGAEVGLRTDFTNAITSTIRSNSSTGALRFLNGATYTEDHPSDAQYVNGYAGKVGTDAFTFPVGDQSGTDRRTLSITAPVNPGTHLSIAYWNGDPGTALDPTGGAHSRGSINLTALNGEILLSVSPLGFWDWIPVTGTDNMTITVSKPAETGLGSYSSAANIRLVGWNVANGQWELLGNSAASSLLENATLSGATNAYPGRTMASYSAIGWGSIAQFPLPVKLLSFDGNQQGCSVQLNWATASEQNSKQFIVERSSDGSPWQTAGIVAATGNSNNTINYSYVDGASIPGIYYYRLRQEDLDGRYEYSYIVSVKLNCGKSNYYISPNPVQDRLTIQVPEGSLRLVQMYNAAGQLMNTLSIAGNTIKTINTSQWAKGMYYVVVIEDGQQVYTQKLIKK